MNSSVEEYVWILGLREAMQVLSDALLCALAVLCVMRDMCLIYLVRRADWKCSDDGLKCFFNNIFRFSSDRQVHAMMFA